MMPARARVTAAVVGITAAAGVALAGAMPSAHADDSHTPAASISFNDQPGLLAGTCDVAVILTGTPGQQVQYVVVVRGQQPLYGRTVVLSKGRIGLADVLVASGTPILATATGARPAREIAAC